MPAPAQNRSLRFAGLALTASVALYIAIVAFSNITDFGTNQAFVRHVLTMDTTFKDDDLTWRAITSHTVADAVYVVIIAWEALAALILVLAAVLWIPAPARARRVSTLGLVLLMVLFGAGFIGIGGEWFAMWQSKDWNGVEAATRVFVFAGISLLVVNLPGDRS
ncbi:MAG: hypothetical protein QOF84_5861 [Streptomyces sp.]|jgi:predicted small integral membrane protein|nr:hypothetical protein [Streptomyces sp.]